MLETASDAERLGDVASEPVNTEWLLTRRSITTSRSVIGRARRRVAPILLWEYGIAPKVHRPGSSAAPGPALDSVCRPRRRGCNTSLSPWVVVQLKRAASIVKSDVTVCRQLRPRRYHASKSASSIMAVGCGVVTPIRNACVLYGEYWHTMLPESDHYAATAVRYTTANWLTSSACL